MRVMALRLGSTALLVLTVLTAHGVAATQSSPSAVAEAERLRAEKRFAEAVQLLDAHLAAHRDDGTALRLLAQTLYWMQDVSRARDVYERARRLHPEDSRLLLDYGRMLLETGDRGRARVLLEPLTEGANTRAESSALLGTLAYWEGDFTAARRLFLDAVAAGSTDRQVLQHMTDIRIVTAPWLRFTPVLFTDDQPLDRAGARLEAGWFLTPLVPVELGVDWSRSRTDDGTWQTVRSAAVELAAYVPSARLDVQTAVGLALRPAPIERQWTGQLAAGFRLGGGVSVGGRLDRSVYLHTASSLDRDVTVTTAGVAVAIDNARGWTGDAALERRRFFDGNHVRSASFWLLAPIANKSSFGLQLGYAGAISDSDELRFVLPLRDRQQLLQAPATTGLGRYDPYHTPIDLETHSLLAAVRATGTRANLRLSGSFGFRADEDFPFFYLSATAVPQLGLAHRQFTPWTGRVAADLHVSHRVTIGLHGEAGRGAFYDWLTGGVQLHYRFAPGAAGDTPNR